MTATRRLLVVLALLIGSLMPANLLAADMHTCADLQGQQYWVRKTYYSDDTFSEVVGYHEKYCNGTTEQFGIVTDYVDFYAEPCNGGYVP